MGVPISSSNLADVSEKAGLTPDLAAASVRPTTSETVKAPSAVVGSFVPDWAPWGVLGALLAVGFLGGTGVLPMPDFRRWTAPASPAQPASPSVEVTVREARASAALPSAANDEKIEVLHIVVSHAGTQLGRHHNITRSRAEARKRAQEARARALEGEDFTALIAEYTDEPKASGRNGRIGPFRRKHAIQPFSDVAFALKVGEISAVTETELGIHVIQRTR